MIDLSPETLTAAIKAAWAELQRQNEASWPGVYTDAEAGVIDGDVNMEALVKAILSAAEKA